MASESGLHLVQLQLTRIQTETGRIKPSAVRSALGISDTWLSKARKVIAILKEIGPDGSEPDLLVEARLQPDGQKKGVELYRFLVDRRAALT